MHSAVKSFQKKISLMKSYHHALIYIYTNRYNLILMLFCSQGKLFFKVLRKSCCSKRNQNKIYLPPIVVKLNFVPSLFAIASLRKTLKKLDIYIHIYIEIEKVDVFCKVFNKQFIERLRAISIINKTQL